MESILKTRGSVPAVLSESEAVLISVFMLAESTDRSVITMFFEL